MIAIGAVERWKAIEKGAAVGSEDKKKPSATEHPFLGGGWGEGDEMVDQL